MKDLIISYDNENGKTINASYNTIMDFIDEMESDKDDIPMLDYSNVYAEFFERIQHPYRFNTIGQLLDHCRMIVK